MVRVNWDGAGSRRHELVSCSLYSRTDLAKYLGTMKVKGAQLAAMTASI